MTEDDKEILNKWVIEVEAFKQFCIRSNKPEMLTDEEIDYVGKEPYEEINFYDLSIGFFMAKDVPLIDSFKLASITRYDLQYWC